MAWHIISKNCRYEYSRTYTETKQRQKTKTEQQQQHQQQWILRWNDTNILSCLIDHSVLLPSIGTSLSHKPEIVFNYNEIIIWAKSFMRKGQHVLLFLKRFSKETYMWVTQGSFTIKKGKFVFFISDNWLNY